jgi:hypothetical protein
MSKTASLPLTEDLINNRTANVNNNDDTAAVTMNDVAGAGLAEILAKADTSKFEKISNDGGSQTASLTAVESSATFETLDRLSISPQKKLTPFTDHQKVMLRAILTPIDDYVHFEKKAGTRFIPIIEARGGTDKDPISGHRRDSIPIATQISAKNESASGILFFLDDSDSQDEVAVETNTLLRRFLLRTATGVVVRVNPGTLSSAAQAKLDILLTELSSAGISVMSTPQVMRQMGAKDSLVKIRSLRSGLHDTAVYYDAQSFQEGFLRSIAYRPRVIKQNRGSQGEGIWICKLQDETAYCANLGDKVATLDTPLVLMEANDNHVEHHTVGELFEFVCNGRTEQSGEWSSAGTGRYLEGGIDAGAMLVDQRFLPRIVEGEVRCNMIGSDLVNLVHKVPKAGGLSATLQSGAVYTSYSPESAKFANLVETFRADLPNIMAAFGMEGEPLPLLWTADFIFDYDENGNDVFYIGEFNCSCVGITKDIHLATKVAEKAIETIEKTAAKAIGKAVC